MASEQELFCIFIRHTLGAHSTHLLLQHINAWSGI